MVSDQIRRSGRVRKLLVIGARYKQALDQASKTGSRQAIADLASGLREVEGLGAELADICVLAHVVDGCAIPAASIDARDVAPLADDGVIDGLSLLGSASPFNAGATPSPLDRGTTSRVFRVSAEASASSVAKVTTPSARQALDDDRAILATLGSALTLISRGQVLASARSLFDELLALASAELDAGVEWQRMRLAVDLLARSQLPTDAVPLAQQPSDPHTLIMREALVAPKWSEPSIDTARDIFLGLVVGHGVLHRQFLGRNVQPTAGGGTVIFDWASICTISEDLRAMLPQIRLALDGDPSGPDELAEAVAVTVELPRDVVVKLVKRLLASVEPVAPWLASGFDGHAVNAPEDEVCELPTTSMLFGLSALAAGLLNLAGLRRQACSPLP